MIMRQKTLIGLGPSEDSGVHKIPGVEKDMEKSRQRFADFIEALEKDDLLGPLVRGGFHNGRRQEGLLRSTVYQFNKFYDWVFLDHGNFLDNEKTLHQLESIFERTIKDTISQWPRLSAQGVVWNELCGSLESYFERLAGIFSLDNQMHFYIRKWFDTYARNQLNAQALEAYQQLAFHDTMGGAENEQIKKVRGKISAIDKKLVGLPLKPENYPAFSKQNPQTKVLIQPGTPKKLNKDHLVVTLPGKGRTQKVEKYPSPWVEPPQQTARAAGKKPWWKFW